MSTIKRYQVTWTAHQCDPVLIVEIDHAVCTNELLHEMNNFFAGAKYRLDQSHGNITTAILKQLATECFNQQSDLSCSWSTQGLINQFANGNIEGFPPMDGSAGIKIIDCDTLYINDEDMRVEEISSCEAV